MNKLVYNTGNGPSEIYFNLSLEQVIEKIKPEETVIITDSNIRKLYGSRFPKCVVIEIPPGEKGKNLDTIESIIEKLLQLEIDRSHFLLGIGGGVICDITGFVASIYMRGIQFGFVSTSLLSQIDASTGGKNGVNVGGFKNVAGFITQPRFVICDPKLLITLSDEEYLSGLGELVKYALIKDKNLFELLENNIELIKKRDAGLLASVIETSIKIKVAVVEKDEKETGERRLLNFGHTIGHAIELHTGIKHGLAVAQGMQIASNLSVEEGLLTFADSERITNLLKKLGLINGKVEINDSIIELIKRDKKREKKVIHFVFLNGIGNGIVKAISMEGLIEQLKKI
jgi:3-dehydroquinate synthase